MTTPATPPPPAPVPPELPEGYRLFTEADYEVPGPMDLLYSFEGSPWFRSNYRGRDVPEGMGKYYATRAPLPTASESSGVRQAREEIERLKAELNVIASIVSPHELDVTKRNDVLYAVELYAAEKLQTEHALAAAQALAQEGELKQMTAERDSLRMSVQIVQKNRDEWERSWGDVVRERDKLRALLATPSPAPVAGKTNPPEISSPVVDAGEKDSGGLTPRTDADWNEAAGFKDSTRALVMRNRAMKLERELTASESLLSYAENCLHWGTSFADYERQKELLLTPPVAGGEGK